MHLVPDAEPAQFRLSEVLGALSHALDLTEGQPVGHAARTTVLAPCNGCAFPRTSAGFWKFTALASESVSE